MGDDPAASIPLAYAISFRELGKKSHMGTGPMKGLEDHMLVAGPYTYERARVNSFIDLVIATPSLKNR